MKRSRLVTISVVALFLLLSGSMLVIRLDVQASPVDGGTTDAAATSVWQSLASPAAVDSSWTPPDPAYRISVASDGLFALSYAYLAGAGLPVDSIDPRTFRMFYMGQEIPIQVIGEADGIFQAGDVVLFYGRSVDSLFYEGLVPTNKYSGTNIYWLTYGGSNGLRMAEDDGSLAGSTPGPYPRTEHLETNRFYFSDYPFEHDADHWYNFAIQATGSTPASRNYAFTARNIAVGPYTGTLTVSVLGYQAASHHLRLYVNNQLVFDQPNYWSGLGLVTATAAVPQAFFVEGTNNVKIELVNDPPQTIDRIYPNWIKVTYYDTHVAESNRLTFDNPNAGTWRYPVSNFSTSDITVYDVGDPFSPRRVVSTTVTGTGPYTVNFGDSATSASRFLALTPAAWLTPSAIQLVTNLTSVYTPLDLLDTSNQFDYILITHGNFWSQAQQLAAHRSSNYRVALVDVQRIYDQFNGGVMSAEAIHDFLAFAHTNWTPPVPMYVLLMGDGTYDLRNYAGSGTPTYLPPYLYLADPDLGETAADNRFVTIVGNDNVPDMHIGRLPVNTPQQAQDMVAKIIAYEVDCLCDTWNYNTLFIADDLEGGGGNFRAFSDEIADGYADPPTNTIKIVPAAYNIQKVYLGVDCDVTNPAVATECRNEITTTLNTTGALFVSYVGHATKTDWAAERLLDLTMVNQLQNGPCLPVMLAMTCFEGFFHEPGQTFQSLAEASTRMPLHGSIASWSPTGFGLVTGHDFLEEGLLLALLHDGVEQLGAATTAGKRFLYDSPEAAGRYRDLLDTFMLFGDPALVLKTEPVCSQIPTAVQLAAFGVQADAGGIQVGWETASEVDILGFNVLRSPGTGNADKAQFVPLNEELIVATWAGAHQGASYGYLDTHVVPGQAYRYKLELVLRDGQRQLVGPRDVTAAGPRLSPPIAD